MNPIIVENGIVLMLDGLGVKQLNTSTSNDFLLKWNALYNEIQIFAKDTFKLGDVPLEHRLPKTLIFGDTILCVWDSIFLNFDMAFTFLNAVYFGANAIKKGIEKGILLRGAITTGEFCYSLDDNNNFSSFIGPAISDVASWYEEIEWFGIIATPHCHLNIPCWLKKLEETSELHSDFISGLEEYADVSEDKEVNIVHNLLVKYKVISKTDTQELFTVKWPLLVYKEHRTDSTNWLNFQLAKLQIPKGTEKKYWNSIEYYNFIISSLLKHK